MLDSSTGRLGSDFAQVRMLRDALDAAATDSSVTGVLVFSHHPLDDPLPTKASQLSDRLEADTRSEEHTSELQSLMRISYAVFCLNKKINQTHLTNQLHT